MLYFNAFKGPFLPAGIRLAVGCVVILAASCQKTDPSVKRSGGEVLSGSSEESKSESSGEEAGAESEKTKAKDDISFTETQEPVPVTGLNLVTLDYDNARNRCDFETNPDASYTILCRAVSMIGGREFVPDLVKPGVEIKWLPPVLSNKDQAQIFCDVDKNQLLQTCKVVTSESGLAVKVSHEFTVSEKTSGRTRPEKAVVYLPYYVGVAAGVVPAIPFRYKKQDPNLSSAGNAATPESSPPSEHGLQKFIIGDRDATLAYFTSICFRGDNFAFFSAGQFIYEWDLVNKTVTLFAGSMRRDFERSHRYRTNIQPNHLTCMKDHLIVSDAVNNQILRIFDKGHVEVIAGSAEFGFEGDGGPAILAKINQPIRHFVAADGSILFVDYRNFRIRKIDSSGIISTIAGNGVEADGPNQVIATESSFLVPLSVFQLKNGDLLVSDLAKIRRIDKSGVIHHFAGAGFGFAGDGGLARDGLFGAIGSIIEDEKGDIYVGDLTHYRVRKISPEGVLSTVAGNGNSGPVLTEAIQGELAVINQPLNFGFDGKKIFVTNHLGVQTISKDGVVSIVLGPQTKSTPEIVAGSDFVISRWSRIGLSDGGRLSISDFQSGKMFRSDASRSQFSRVVSWNSSTQSQGAFDKSGELMYFVSPGVIRKATVNGVFDVAGSGTYGYLDHDDPLQGRIGITANFAVASDGALFFLDMVTTGQGVRLRKVGTDNKLVTIGGDINAVGFSPDGTPVANARLNSGPMAFGPDGTLYLGQTGRIRSLDSEWKLKTVGGGGADSISDGIDASLASIMASRISVANDGRIFYIDLTANSLRVLKPRVNENQSISYTVETFFAAKSDLDCATGLFSGQEESSNVSQKIRTSLSMMCAGDLVDLAIHDTCPAAGGKTTISFLQIFDQLANVIVVEQPCD